MGLQLSPRTDGQQFDLDKEGYVAIVTFLHSTHEVLNVHLRMESFLIKRLKLAEGNEIHCKAG